MRSSFRILFLLLFTGLTSVAARALYAPSKESPPPIPTEFRGAWVAVVYNIDWPSKAGLSATAQRAELTRLMDRAASLGLNAIIFQVRPAADSIYPSKIEPWSHWLTGLGGGNPGYDPLRDAIQLAHARGLELHAWFNPFRAQAHVKHPLGKGHIARSGKRWVKRFRDHQWCDPSSVEARSRALKVILDVVRRYDIDGVHIDDYFYPYPRTKQGRSLDDFPDASAFNAYRNSGGRLSRHDWRRDQVNLFVRSLYQQVKQAKPWLRVGISPFGIWRPGVPAGIEASLDSYDHLFADSRLWLKRGWCDYLAPQLYWRDSGPQSFSKLLSWWRSQNSARPVWPGIATARINSKEDPGRPASEILKQIQLTRSLGKHRNGHLHWSMKSLLQNRDGISTKLPASYRGPALPPPMPWSGTSKPSQPLLQASQTKNGVELRFQPGKGGTGVRKWVIQVKQGAQWRIYQILQGPYQSLSLPFTPDAVALSPVNGFGMRGAPAVLQRVR